MNPTLAGQVLVALSEFSGRTRLYELKLAVADMLVEAFAADEQLQGIGVRDLIALSTRANIAHSTLLGQEASLEISLPDGTRAGFSGYISQVATLGSDGGLSRYRLRLSPWIWLLNQVRNSRAWQDSRVIEIIDPRAPSRSRPEERRAAIPYATPISVRTVRPSRSWQSQTSRSRQSRIPAENRVVTYARATCSTRVDDSPSTARVEVLS